MPFNQDVAFAEEIGQSYGRYHSTFRSQTGQVLAQIFERNSKMEAHVSFPTGVKPEELTDPYVGELNRYAAEQGFAGKLRLIYSD